MKLYYPITVDLYNLYPLKKMDAQQGNIGRGTLVTLTAAGQVMEPDNETITLWAKKPDGKVSYLPCQVTGGKIKADFTNQMLAAPGAVQVELQMIDGEDNITTPIFTITVHPSNIDSTTVESQNEFTVLQTAIENMNTALQEVDELKKTGLKGDPGEPGKDGAPGAAATVGIGTVEASDPGSDPQVTNSGTANAAILNFVLPRGQAGPPGVDGKEQVFFGAYADFPAEGNSGMLYVDTSNTAVLLMYRWNGSAYVPSGGGSADLDVVAQEFDDTKAYTKGEYVIYSGGLYCFASDKAAGEWDSTIVTPTTVGVELNALNANISIIMEKLFPETPFIYENGNEYPEITGGWIGSASGGSATKNDDYLYLASTNPMGPSNSYHAQFYTNLKIDISEYKYLHIDGYYTGNSGVIFLSNEKFDFTYSAMNVKPVAKWSLPKNNRANSEYDISELQGEYYIGLATVITGSTQTPPKAYCYRLWMSK